MTLYLSTLHRKMLELVRELDEAAKNDRDHQSALLYCKRNVADAELMLSRIIDQKEPGAAS